MNVMTLVMFLAVGLAAVCVVQFVINGRRAAAEDKVMKGYFLLGLSGIIAKVAMADGKVTDDETALAQKFFDDMDITPAEKAMCVGNFVVARRDGLSVRDHTNRFIASANLATCRFLYDMVWRMARADGVVDPAEDKLLKDIALYLGLPESDYEQFRNGQHVSHNLDNLRNDGVPTSLLGLAR